MVGMLRGGGMEGKCFSVFQVIRHHHPFPSLPPYHPRRLFGFLPAFQTADAATPSLPLSILSHHLAESYSSLPTAHPPLSTSTSTPFPPLACRLGRVPGEGVQI